MYRLVGREVLISLDLVECDDVNTLDVLVVRFTGEIVFNEVVWGHEVINDREHDRELLDPITNWNQLCCNNLNTKLEN